MIRKMLAFLILPLTAALSVADGATAAGKPVLALRAFAVNMNGAGRARAGSLDITVERWSTDAEREQLRSALIEKGSGALLDALQKIKPRVGYIRSSTSLGWDLQYARERVLDDGTRRIVVATDRPMSFWELSNKPRSSDYEFTLAEIRLDKSGKGEGKLVAAAKITWNQDAKAIEIENYENEPVRLTNVVAQGENRGKGR